MGTATLVGSVLLLPGGLGATEGSIEGLLVFFGRQPWLPVGGHHAHGGHGGDLADPVRHALVWRGARLHRLGHRPGALRPAHGARCDRAGDAGSGARAGRGRRGEPRVSWVWAAGCLLGRRAGLVACGNSNALLSAVSANPGTVQPTDSIPPSRSSCLYPGRPATVTLHVQGGPDNADLVLRPAEQLAAGTHFILFDGVVPVAPRPAPPPRRSPMCCPTASIASWSALRRRGRARSSADFAMQGAQTTAPGLENLQVYPRDDLAQRRRYRRRGPDHLSPRPDQHHLGDPPGRRGRAGDGAGPGGTTGRGADRAV